MSKRRAKAGVGQLQLQIAFPDEPAASDEAGATEGDRPGASARAPGSGAKQQTRRKWYSVIDKVYALPNLTLAWHQVRANGGAAGVDRMTVAKFAERAETHLQTLAEDLRAGTYRPQPVRRVYLPKAGGGQRPLGIPTVRDRIVQQAVRQILEPIFEAKFSPRSHGFRKGRGCASALQVVDRAVKAGYAWVVDADIEAFFDSVDHERLLAAVHEEVTDGSLLRLLRRILEAGVVEPGSAAVEPSELGTPQGSPLSPLLANIYLHPLDERLTAARVGLVRYADDFVLFARSEAEAQAALALAREVLEGELGLRLHPAKTQVVTAAEGFEFLGFRWFWSVRRGGFRKEVSRKSARRFRERVRELTPRLRNQRKPKPRTVTMEKLRRNRRLQRIIAEVNGYLRGWHWYFKELWSEFPDDPFERFDRFVRTRLRSAIVGRTGPGWWNQVLTNARLHGLGLRPLNALQRDWEDHRLQAPVRKDRPDGEPDAGNPHVRFGAAGRGLAPP